MIFKGGYFVEFAHAGHTTNEDVHKISGLSDSQFKKIFANAINMSAHVMKFDGNKLDHFMEHCAKFVDEYMKHFGGKLLQ